jgi:hypothetical protein
VEGDKSKMKFNQNDWKSLLNNQFTRVRTSDQLSWPVEKRLLSLIPHQIPAWRIEVRLSHNKDKTLKWLVCKFLKQDLSFGEREVIKIIAAQSNDLIFTFLTFLLKNYEKFDRKAMLQVLITNLDFPRDPGSYLASFIPSLYIVKLWTSPKFLPDKRFIGVGYKDKGTLSTTPSWKEQITSMDEKESIHEILLFEQLLLACLSRPEPEKRETSLG